MDYARLQHYLSRGQWRRYDPVWEPRAKPLPVEPELVPSSLDLPPEALDVLLREVIWQLVPYWESAAWLESARWLGDPLWRTWVESAIQCVETQDTDIMQCLQRAFAPTQNELHVDNLYHNAELALEHCRGDNDCAEIILQELVALEWLYNVWYYFDQGTPLSLSVGLSAFEGAITIAGIQDMTELGIGSQAVFAFLPQIWRHQEWHVPIENELIGEEDVERRLKQLYSNPPSLPSVWAHLWAALPVRDF